VAAAMLAFLEKERKNVDDKLQFVKISKFCELPHMKNKALKKFKE
jgi:hypothetical protein